jgi:hypothetical protein
MKKIIGICFIVLSCLMAFGQPRKGEVVISPFPKPIEPPVIEPVIEPVVLAAEPTESSKPDVPYIVVSDTTNVRALVTNAITKVTPVTSRIICTSVLIPSRCEDAIAALGQMVPENDSQDGFIKEMTSSALAKIGNTEEALSTAESIVETNLRSVVKQSVYAHSRRSDKSNQIAQLGWPLLVDTNTPDCFRMAAGYGVAFTSHNKEEQLRVAMITLTNVSNVTYTNRYNGICRIHDSTVQLAMLLNGGEKQKRITVLRHLVKHAPITVANAARLGRWVGRLRMDGAADIELNGEVESPEALGLMNVYAQIEEKSIPLPYPASSWGEAFANADLIRMQKYVVLRGGVN